LADSACLPACPNPNQNLRCGASLANAIYYIKPVITPTNNPTGLSDLANMTFQNKKWVLIRRAATPGKYYNYIISFSFLKNALTIGITK